MMEKLFTMRKWGNWGNEDWGKASSILRTPSPKGEGKVHHKKSYFLP
jgi:hypothetical protein